MRSYRRVGFSVLSSLVCAGQVRAEFTRPAQGGLPTSAATVARISNLSVRTSAGSGSDTLIVGISVGGGTGNLTTLLRGVGPALVAYGVAEAHPDPRLTVLAGSTTVATNDDWGTPASHSGPLATAANSVGAFVLPPGSKDAALIAALPPGGYTAQVTGANGTSGIVLMEAYDLTASGDAALRLTNCSARAFVGTGSGILIAGFVVSGGPKKILIRGVGPALAQYGVSGVLEDPLLSVFSDATLLANNDDWNKLNPISEATLQDAFKSVGAFSLTSDAKDAAVIVTLQPGSYTAQVRGFGGTTGVALIELYELP